MSNEQTKFKISVMQAACEGATIEMKQVLPKEGPWVELQLPFADACHWDWDRYTFRVKLAVT